MKNSDNTISGGRNGSGQFAALFGPRHVLCRTPLRKWEDVVRALLRLLAEDGRIGDAAAAFQAVFEREKEQSTVLAPGIAMPHARMDSVSETAVAMATSQSGIEYFASPSDRIKLLILILVPKDAPGLYLQVAGSLMRIIQKPATLPALLALRTAEEVWRFFEAGNHTLPEHLTAADIMRRDIVKIRQNDTLEHAIDMFVGHEVVELPVVDENDEQVGVVSAQQLLKVALPQHFLWMEDLSPIMHFEPFAAVLRKESRTWLMDIMAEEYVAVQVEAPAAQVAREMVMHNTGIVFVLRGKKLVGEITLHDFISRVLRDRNV